MDINFKSRNTEKPENKKQRIYVYIIGGFMIAVTLLCITCAIIVHIKNDSKPTNEQNPMQIDQQQSFNSDIDSSIPYTPHPETVYRRENHNVQKKSQAESAKVKAPYRKSEVIGKWDAGNELICVFYRHNGKYYQFTEPSLDFDNLALPLIKTKLYGRAAYRYSDTDDLFFIINGNGELEQWSLNYADKQFHLISLWKKIKW